MHIKQSLFLLVAPLLLLSSTAQSSPYVIQDNYIGGGATHASWNNHDVIGSPLNFDISHMEIDITGSKLTVSIFSTYFKNVGYLNTVLGDLFISTNGWNPSGDAPYASDTYHNGTKWDLAITLDNHGGTVGTETNHISDFTGESGVASLYQIYDENIILTNVSGGYYRGDQVTQYDNSSQQALALGNWFIDAISGSDYAKLTFELDFTGLNLYASDQIGFHWNMSCGNDTIQGAYTLPTSQAAFITGTTGGGGDNSIPEPSVIFLLGAGLVGLKKRKLR
ncbi:MAG TPA: PEP-CTERM sorting domain-containing protein [Oligoflexia bacterium]|nr:PEP-CTERM sorting domain-containing protein [Oligoflexia bacterium]